MTVKELLDNYRADLEYQGAFGLSKLNNTTSGTPCFEDYDEFRRYIRVIGAAIRFVDEAMEDDLFR